MRIKRWDAIRRARSKAQTATGIRCVRDLADIVDAAGAGEAIGLLGRASQSQRDGSRHHGDAAPGPAGVRIAQLDDLGQRVEGGVDILRNGTVARGAR